MEFPITTSGIIFITMGWGFVISLFLSCNVKVLKSGNKLETSLETSEE